MKTKFAALAIIVGCGPSMALAFQTAPAVPDAATANATMPAVPLTDKEQKTLERCKKMTTQQLDQNSKCTALIEKAGGSILRQDVNANRQQQPIR